jgi:hypothetical protein
MNGVVRIISIGVSLIANLIPLFGVLYWQWDAFQLLMLYWTETVIIAFWTIVGIARLPVSQLGTITVNGRVRPATHKTLCGYFTLVAAMFILGHLLLLWVLFSGEWLSKLPATSSILNALFVTDGLWLALIAMFLSASLSQLGGAQPPQVAAIEPTPGSMTPLAQEPQAGSDAVGAIAGGLFVRIFIMQAAIIFGGMLSKTYGSIAPLLIVIGCKTLIDMGAAARPSPCDQGHDYRALTGR